MLELGCGTGRHARYLASKGFQVTGLDLAFSSIREARRSQLPGVKFFEHHMRAPFGTNAFDYVFNFFTSFAYFDEPAEHVYGDYQLNPYDAGGSPRMILVARKIGAPLLPRQILADWTTSIRKS